MENLSNIHDVLAGRLAPDQDASNYSILDQADINEVREALEDENVCRAVVAILIEHQRACRKWPVWPTDIVHAAGIVAGEGGELLKAANHLREGRPTEGRDSLFMVEVEAIHTGAMALRLLANHPGSGAQ